MINFFDARVIGYLKLLFWSLPIFRVCYNCWVSEIYLGTVLPGTLNRVSLFRIVFTERRK
jgi:hypothetical protein